MKKISAAHAFLAVLAAVLLAGCASTQVTGRQILVTEKLPRPDHIWVYNFAATPEEVPTNSDLAASAAAPATPPTAQQAQLAAELGKDIAIQLVENLDKAGLPAAKAWPGVVPAVNDIVIRGYLVSVEKGSAAKRMTLGFGAGNSELGTFVEGYQMTTNGLRKLGSGELNAKGGKGPGMALGGAAWLITGSPIGLIVGGGMKVYGEASGNSTVEGRAQQTAKELSDAIKARCQQQGWIE